MSLKRQRINEGLNLLEAFGTLYRQATTRAMERLRLQLFGRVDHRSNYSNRFGENSKNVTGKTIRPIDRLVLIFSMFYMSVADLVPPHHFLLLAQDTITKSEERVRRRSKSFFEPVRLSLPLLCESLMEEYASNHIEETVREIEEFIVTRERIGDYLLETTGASLYDDIGLYGENEEDPSSPSVSSPVFAEGKGTVALLTRLYQNLEFFQHIRLFFHALSRDAAANALSIRKKNVSNDALPLPPTPSHPPCLPRLFGVHQHPSTSLAFQPRYERELMLLLASAAQWQSKPGASSLGYSPTSAFPQPTAKCEDDLSNAEAIAIKKEPVDEEDLSGSSASPSSSYVRAADIIPAGSNVEVEYEGDSPQFHGKLEENEEALDEGVFGARKKVGESTSEAQKPFSQDSDDESSYELRRATSTALLADLLALSHIPSSFVKSEERPSSSPTTTGSSTKPIPSVLANDSLEKLRGFYPPYYQLIHARLSVMVARQQLQRFSQDQRVAAPPELTAAQQAVIAEEEEQMAQARLRRQEAQYGGVALDHVPDEAYYQRMLRSAYGSPTADVEEQEQSTVDGVGLSEDEELFTGEVMDYYLRKQTLETIKEQGEAQKAQPGGPVEHRQRPYSSGRRSNADVGDRGNGSSGVLVKPDRVCKVKTGFTWTQYNRTHYDSRTNPPPKSVMWYDFTLFYPALARTRRNPMTFFRVEDTPNGPNDIYCLLVFSVGPPYADVAYRIERKQWDPRRGGVRISFDANGKFRLFFRFSNSNYRR